MSESIGLFVERQEAINLPSNLVQMFPQIATLGALVLVAMRIHWSEILRRRTFVRDFSAQLDDLKQKVISKPAAGD